MTGTIRTIPQALGQQLGQVNPVDTNDATLYSPASGVVATVDRIFVCNVTASSAKYRIFHDDNGSAFGTATALFLDVPIPANSTDILEVGVEMADDSGALGVRSDTPSALCFTAYGRETQAQTR